MNIPTAKNSLALFMLATALVASSSWAQKTGADRIRVVSSIPVIQTPAIIKRRGPKRSTSHPAKKPDAGPITNLLMAFPDVTCPRVQPNCRTMKSQ